MKRPGTERWAPAALTLVLLAVTGRWIMRASPECLGATGLQISVRPAP